MSLGEATRLVLSTALVYAVLAPILVMGGVIYARRHREARDFIEEAISHR